MHLYFVRNRPSCLKAALLFVSIVVAVLISACEQIVTVDLNKADPRLVIEGNISDQPGPFTVTLSKSGNYFENSLYFPPVSHAQVLVTDDLGRIDTLREVETGTYRSSTLQGTPGRTYMLDVLAEEKRYNALSSMPAKVTIDSLYAILRQGSGSRGQPGYDIYVTFKDPPERDNYYRLNAHASSLIPADSIDGRRYRLYSDKLTNGNEMTERIRARHNLVAGDTVTVELLSIDQTTYDYYATLRDILTSDRSPSSLSPTNPNTNLSNGSLGYFAAYTIDLKKIILK
jgi:hypothetical protein